MNALERFLCICRGEKPDYIPIFGLPGAPGFSGGCIQRTAYDRLLSTGMPDIGGAAEIDGSCTNIEGWNKFWGVCNPMDFNEFPGEEAEPLKWDTQVDGDFEILTCETGAKTRQVIDNWIQYSMPEYIKFHVTDRSSWECYKERCTPGKPWSDTQINAVAAGYAARTQPLCMFAYGTFGWLRALVGPEMACTILYDDPDLAKEILGWAREHNQKYYFPLIRRLRPEILIIGEDMCYNHGMFISPAMFNEFCAPAYIEAAEVVREAGVTLFAVDSDGFVEQLIPLLEAVGVNGLYPWEVKAGNDILRVREKHPNFVILGGIEKEILNEGNEKTIRPEIMGKVPQMLRTGRYFPNGDHGIQPLLTYENLLRTMTLLHEVCENPEGEFPRVPV